jgi:hypothetical protein
MAKKDSPERDEGYADPGPPRYSLADLSNPLPWFRRQSYGQLKNWLRWTIWRHDPRPLTIPHDTMPVSFLADFILRADNSIKMDFRTIIPELLKEWGAYDDRQCLDHLLILCGVLNCNEAESVISQIVTGKLANSDEDVRLRRRGLSVLQNIGTERTLHLFRRYISDLRYAALCYRGLYRFNLIYAATELPELVHLYQREGSVEELKDVLKILFHCTITTPEYISVLLPFVEQAPLESFVEVLEILREIDVFSETFVSQLPRTHRTELVKQLILRAREEDSGEIVKLLASVGIIINPPHSTTGPLTAQSLVPIGRGRYFTLNASSSGSELTEPDILFSELELGKKKTWAISREYKPGSLISLFENKSAN